jgi:large conductance mechanosensitive channel
LLKRCIKIYRSISVTASVSRVRRTAAFSRFLCGVGRSNGCGDALVLARPAGEHVKKGEPMFKEFKEFATRGSMLDLAIGIIMGAAFGAIVNSLVADIIMPPIGMLLGNVDFKNMYVLLKEGAKAAAPYASLESAKAAGAITMNYGVFVNLIITFIIVAFVVFLIVKAVNKSRKKSEVADAAPTKDCPFCLTAVPQQATRCPACTSALEKV